MANKQKARHLQPGALPVQEAKGSIVDREPHNAHVVSVEHAMAKANTLPFSHHPCRSTCHLEQSRLVAARLPSLMPEHSSASRDASGLSVSGSQCKASNAFTTQCFRVCFG